MYYLVIISYDNIQQIKTSIVTFQEQVLSFCCEDNTLEHRMIIHRTCNIPKLHRVLRFNYLNVTEGYIVLSSSSMYFTSSTNLKYGQFD